MIMSHFEKKRAGHWNYVKIANRGLVEERKLYSNESIDGDQGWQKAVDMDWNAYCHSMNDTELLLRPEIKSQAIELVHPQKQVPHA